MVNIHRRCSRSLDSSCLTCSTSDYHIRHFHISLACFQPFQQLFNLILSCHFTFLVSKMKLKSSVVVDIVPSPFQIDKMLIVREQLVVPVLLRIHQLACDISKLSYADFLQEDYQNIHIFSIVNEYIQVLPGLVERGAIGAWCPGLHLTFFPIYLVHLDKRND